MLTDFLTGHHTDEPCEMAIHSAMISLSSFLIPSFCIGADRSAIALLHYFVTVLPDSIVFEQST